MRSDKRADPSLEGCIATLAEMMGVPDRGGNWIPPPPLPGEPFTVHGEVGPVSDITVTRTVDRIVVRIRHRGTGEVESAAITMSALRAGARSVVQSACMELAVRVFRQWSGLAAEEKRQAKRLGLSSEGEV